MAKTTYIEVGVGTSKDIVLTVVGDDHNIVPLGNKDVFAKMAKHYSSKNQYPISVSVYGDPLNGQILLSFTPTLTQIVKPGRYDFDVSMLDSAQTTGKIIIRGTINMIPVLSLNGTGQLTDPHGGTYGGIAGG